MLVKKGDIISSLKEINQIFVKSPFIFESRKKKINLECDDILVKIKACGICGTDFHIAKDGADDFIPLGHEVSGIIEDIGKNVSRFKIGDTVVAENHTLCGVCENCKNGKPEFCNNFKLFYGLEAGLADYIVLNQSMLNSFDDLSFEEAVMAEPLTVALDLVKALDISFNSEIAIFGSGTIGLLILQLVKMMGAKNVLLVEGNQKDPNSVFKLQLGKFFGADEVIGYSSNNFYAFIEDKYPNGFDNIIITSPPHVMADAIKISKFGGVIGLIGITFDQKRIVNFDMNEFHFKRLQLRCIHAIPNLYFPLALDIIKNKKIEVRKLITHRIKFANYQDAFKILGDKNQEAIKIMIMV